MFFLFFNTGPTNTILANVTHPLLRAPGFALNILVIHLLGDAVSPPIMAAIAASTPTLPWFCSLSSYWANQGLLLDEGLNRVHRRRSRDSVALPTRSSMASGRGTRSCSARARATLRSYARRNPRMTNVICGIRVVRTQPICEPEPTRKSRHTT